MLNPLPLDTYLFSCLAFVFGACIGSFLNVVILRWKTGESIVFPPSHCSRCRQTLKWYENIPLFSYIALCGRCSHCKKPISLQYPAVEALTGVLFAVWVFRFPNPAGLIWISGPIFLSFLVLLSTTDLKWGLLPHPVNNLFMACGLLFAVFFHPVWGAQTVRDGLMGFVVLSGFLLVMEGLFPGRMGGGDIKMAGGMGAWLGFSNGLVALGGSFGLGAMAAIGVILTGRGGLKTKLPFAPFLAVGGALVAGTPNLQGVLGLGVLNWLKPLLTGAGGS